MVEESHGDDQMTQKGGLAERLTRRILLFDATGVAVATKRVEGFLGGRAARQEKCCSARGLRVLTSLLMGV